MNYNFIQTSKEDHVFTLTLDRDAKRNAFTPAMVNEVAHALQEAEQDAEVKILVLKANGSVFCAGMDLKTYQDRSLDFPNPNIEQVNISLGEVFDRFNKPSVAIVEGDVIAGGFLFILGCTYVYAKHGLNFRLPEINLGIFPFQVMASLTRIMPEKQVLQLCLDPKPFDTERAKALGIVDEYLEYVNVPDFLRSFGDKSVYAMQAGMEALKAIRQIEPEKQYDYLLSCLEKLKDKEEVKQQIQATLKKP